MPKCAVCGVALEPPVRVPHTVYVKKLYRIGWLMEPPPDLCGNPAHAMLNRPRPNYPPSASTGTRTIGTRIRDFSTPTASPGKPLPHQSLPRRSAPDE